jgi:hypothetical protein
VKGIPFKIQTFIALLRQICNSIETFHMENPHHFYHPLHDVLLAYPPVPFVYQKVVDYKARLGKSLELVN